MVSRGVAKFITLTAMPEPFGCPSECEQVRNRLLIATSVRVNIGRDRARHRGSRESLFGGDVSAAGLVTGGSDVLRARDQLSGTFVVIPRCMLKSDEEVMLDGTTLADLSKPIGRPIYPTELASFSQVLVANSL